MPPKKKWTENEIKKMKEQISSERIDKFRELMESDVEVDHAIRCWRDLTQLLLGPKMTEWGIDEWARQQWEELQPIVDAVYGITSRAPPRTQPKSPTGPLSGLLDIFRNTKPTVQKPSIRTPFEEEEEKRPTKKMTLKEKKKIMEDQLTIFSEQLRGLVDQESSFHDVMALRDQFAAYMAKNEEEIAKFNQKRKSQALLKEMDGLTHALSESESRIKSKTPQPIPPKTKLETKTIPKDKPLPPTPVEEPVPKASKQVLEQDLRNFAEEKTYLESRNSPISKIEDLRDRFVDYKDRYDNEIIKSSLKVRFKIYLNDIEATLQKLKSTSTTTPSRSTPTPRVSDREEPVPRVSKRVLEEDLRNFAKEMTYFIIRKSPISKIEDLRDRFAKYLNNYETEIGKSGLKLEFGNELKKIVNTINDSKGRVSPTMPSKHIPRPLPNVPPYQEGYARPLPEEPTTVSTEESGLTVDVLVDDLRSFSAELQQLVRKHSPINKIEALRDRFIDYMSEYKADIEKANVKRKFLTGLQEIEATIEKHQSRTAPISPTRHIPTSPPPVPKRPVVTKIKTEEAAPPEPITKTTKTLTLKERKNLLEEELNNFIKERNQLVGQHSTIDEIKDLRDRFFDIMKKNANEISKFHLIRKFMNELEEMDTIIRNYRKTIPGRDPSQRLPSTPPPVPKRTPGTTIKPKSPPKSIAETEAIPKQKPISKKPPVVEDESQDVKRVKITISGHLKILREMIKDGESAEDVKEYWDNLRNYLWGREFTEGAKQYPGLKEWVDDHTRGIQKLVDNYGQQYGEDENRSDERSHREESELKARKEKLEQVLKIYLDQINRLVGKNPPIHMVKHRYDWFVDFMGRYHDGIDASGLREKFKSGLQKMETIIKK